MHPGEWPIVGAQLMATFGEREIWTKRSKRGIWIHFKLEVTVYIVS